ncbi:O-antigen ligase family protein [Candidatus Peregrinibacteria bacterium]|nr:O-antigen ligase family protein [Candidatus Peregrinibacteria bacterium]
MTKYLYLGVFLIPLIFNPFAGNETYEVAKQAWFLAFILIYLCGTAISLLRKPKFSAQINSTILLLCLLWLGSFAISTIFSIAPMESFWGDYKRPQGLFIHIFYATHFLICLNLFKDMKYRKAFFNITIVIGFLVAAYAIFQNYGLDPLNQGPLGVFTGRSFSTMGSPSSLGQFLIFPWWIAFSLVVNNFPDKRREWIAPLILAAFFSLALYFSLNRASMLGIFISTLVFLVTKIKSTRAKTIFISTAIIFAVAAGAFAFLRFGDNVKLLSTRSLGSQAILWESALPLIQKHFWIGSGPETVYQTIQTTMSPRLYFYERMMDIPDKLHNALLETLATRGILGFLILLGTIIFILKFAFKKGPKDSFLDASLFSLVAYFISVQFGFSVITHMVFLLGMAALFFALTAKFKTINFNFKLAPKIATGAISATIVIFLISYTYKVARSEFLVSNALSSFFTNDPQAAENFEQAWKNLPYFREIPYMTFSLFNEGIETPAEVIPYLEKAQKQISAVTNNGFYAHLTQAQLLVVEKRFDEAWSEFDKASKLAPHWPGIWYKWGNAAISAGNKQMAKEKFAKFLELAPIYSKTESEQERIFRISNPTYYQVLGLVGTL